MKPFILAATLAAFALSAFAETPPVTPTAPTAAPADADPYLWLEDIESPRALAWV